MPLAVDRMKLDKECLVEMIERSNAWNHPKKMQFEIPCKQVEGPCLYGSNGYLIEALHPTRIITTYNTDWVPEKAEWDPIGAVKKLQTLMEKRYEKMRDAKEEDTEHHGIQSRLNHQIICRLMRAEPEITAIRQRSLEAGNRYGVEAEFYSIIEDSGKHGGDIDLYIPLFFIPGATTEDLRTLALFSMKHQIPKYEDAMSYLKHGIFTEDICQRYIDMHLKNQEPE
jgi:hypothetical protein